MTLRNEFEFKGFLTKKFFTNISYFMIESRNTVGFPDLLIQFRDSLLFLEVKTFSKNLANPSDIIDCRSFVKPKQVSTLLKLCTNNFAGVIIGYRNKIVFHNFMVNKKVNVFSTGYETKISFMQSLLNLPCVYSYSF